MSAPTLDPRIFNHLVNTGVMTSDRVTRKPTVRRCRDCGASVIAAVEDERVGASRVELHPAFLTPLGELQAVMAGVATYDYDPAAVTWRDPCRIRGRPASAVNVLAAHECNGPIYDNGPPPIPLNKKRIITPIECPF